MARARVGRTRIRPALAAFLGWSILGLLPTPDGLHLPLARAASGQEGQAPVGTVIGRITERGTGAPQIGAFVALLDPDDERRAAVLTDESGRYVLRVPASGRYRLRVEGLGVASTFGDFFDFAAGEVREQDLEIAPAALNIRGLEVTGVAQCDLGSGDGSATVRLWDEARKALEVAQWVDEVGYVYLITNFRRVLSPDAKQVFQEQRAEKTLVGRSPFVSIDAETLMAEGFVIQDSLGVSYYGPDASVLLSDAFLAGHCFETVRDGDRIGLSFHPREGRALPDVEGTLWFAQEGVLDRLEFRYTGVTPYEGAEALGGDIEFRRLPQGAWIVQEWAIRMPTAVVESPGGGPARLARIRETGAVVREARSIARVAWPHGEGRGAVLGRVVGEESPGPEAGRVYLSGTTFSATPGPDGSFLIEGVEPGRYTLVFDHPSLSASGRGGTAVPVVVRPDSVSRVAVDLSIRLPLLTDRGPGGVGGPRSCVGIRRSGRPPPGSSRLSGPCRGHDAPDDVPDQLFIDAGSPRPFRGSAHDAGLADGIEHRPSHLPLDPPDLQNEVAPQAYESDELSIQGLEAVPEFGEAYFEPGRGTVPVDRLPGGAGRVVGIGAHAALMKSRTAS